MVGLLYLHTIIHHNNGKDLKVNKLTTKACIEKGTYLCLRWSHKSQETVDFATF